ncbi:hypothetical protein P4185_34675, partial [Bacillus thuringiensis]|nr:hypothetical protein [Bacillus thuringiensis]
MEKQKELVALNEDDRAIALKGLKDLCFSAHQMHELLSQDKLTEEAKALFISLSERYISDVAKATNYESDLAKDRERR